MAAKEKPSSLPRDTDFLSSLPPLLSTEPWLRSWDLLGPRRQQPLAQWKQNEHSVLGEAFCGGSQPGFGWAGLNGHSKALFP